MMKGREMGKSGCWSDVITGVLIRERERQERQGSCDAIAGRKGP